MKYYMYLTILLVIFFFSCKLSLAQDKPIVLNDVKIQVIKKKVKETARGSILDLTKIKEASSWTLEDALKEIPGIEVDMVSKSITYLGKELTILRDGVNVVGFQGQLLNTLTSGVANRYEKIELNLFDLKTERPTLSFIAPKYDEGYSGNLSADVGSNASSLSPSLSLSKGKHFLNIGNSNSFAYSPKSVSSSETNFINSGIRENREDKLRKSNYWSTGLTLSESYAFSNAQTIYASLGYSTNGSSFSNLIRDDQYKDGKLTNAYNSQFRTESNPYANSEFQTNLGYVYKPTSGKNGSSRFDLAIEFNHRKQALNQRSILNSASGILQPNGNFQSLDLGRGSDFFGLIGYEYKHNRLGTFESALKYFSRTQNKNYQYQMDRVGVDSIILQRNNNSYHYGAFLLSWDKEFADFAIRIVLKNDYSTNMNLDYGKNEIFKFATFSPYLSVLKNIANGSVRIEAQYLRTRPGLSALSTVTDYIGKYHASGIQTVGNPDLKPDRALNLSTVCNFNLRGVNLIFSGQFKNTIGAISRYQVATDSNIFMTYRNLAAHKMFKANISSNFYLFPRFSTQLYINNSFMNYQVTQEIRQNTWRFGSGFSFNYKWSPCIQVNTGLDFSAGNTFQSKNSNILRSNFSMRYFKGNFNLGFRINNFHQPYFINETEISGDGYFQETFSKNRQFTAGVNVGYRFGKLKRSAPSTKTIIKDDM